MSPFLGQFASRGLLGLRSEVKVIQLLKDKLADSRFKITNAADLLPDGNVIIAGDGKYVELFHAKTQEFHTISGGVEEAWMYPTVTSLKGGKVLVTGGYNGRMEPTNKAWV